MTDDWRSAIGAAFDAHALTSSALALTYAGAGFEVPEWLRRLESADGPPPSAAEYLVLGDLTGIEPEVLTGEVPPTQTLSVMRSRGQTAPEVAVSRSVELLRVARAVSRLEPHRDRLRGLQELQGLLGGAAPRNPSAARRAGERAAIQVRARLGLGLDPVLDLAGLVEALGVAVESSVDLPDGLHGVTSWTRAREGWIAAVTINANDRWTVRRYTLAHEFCHVLHEDRPEDLTTELGAVIASTPEESRAEGFAAALLVPASGLAGSWRQQGLQAESPHVALARTMWHWGLSRDAACIALENCKQVPWSAADTEVARGRHVGSLIADAGLAEAWAEVAATEGVFQPSTWLVEASTELFLESRLPVTNLAVASREDEDVTLSRLLTVG